jgi:hypothetical protein
MGEVPPAVVTATFYNFAPATVEAAIPSVWEAMTPAEAIQLRDTCIDTALRRSLGERVHGPDIAEAAVLAREAIDGIDSVGRALYGAHTHLPWPELPHMVLWHAATLWREYRGDGHNIVLAANDIDGVECHVLVAARTGSKTAATIRTIRGWTDDEWAGAADRLAARGLVNHDGSFTEAGRTLRREIEIATDQISLAPCRRIGTTGVERLCELMNPLVEHLVQTGAIAGSWPPKGVKVPPKA